MKYMLLIRPEVDFDGEVPEEMVAATRAWVAEMTERGVRQQGAALRPCGRGDRGPCGRAAR